MNLPFSILLAIAVAWTIFFSLFNTPGIRGYRNLGWMGCYLTLVIMLFRIPFTAVLVTWAVFGVFGGLIYIVYEVISILRTPRGENRPSVSFSHVLHGLLAWPIMIPEAIEYTAAELGLLPAPKRVATASKSGEATESREVN